MLLKNGHKEDGIMHTKTMEGLIGARDRKSVVEGKSEALQV